MNIRDYRGGGGQAYVTWQKWQRRFSIEAGNVRHMYRGGRMRFHFNTTPRARRHSPSATWVPRPPGLRRSLRPPSPSSWWRPSCRRPSSSSSRSSSRGASSRVPSTTRSGSQSRTCSRSHSWPACRHHKICVLGSTKTCVLKRISLVTVTRGRRTHFWIDNCPMGRQTRRRRIHHETEKRGAYSVVCCRPEEEITLCLLNKDSSDLLIKGPSPGNLFQGAFLESWGRGFSQKRGHFTDHLESQINPSSPAPI